MRHHEDSEIWPRGLTVWADVSTDWEAIDFEWDLDIPEVDIEALIWDIELPGYEVINIDLLLKLQGLSLGI